MGKISVFYDRTGNALTVWFDDPTKEAFCEEIEDDIVLVKNRRGSVIGFERLSHLTLRQRKQGLQVPVEVQLL